MPVIGPETVGADTVSISVIVTVTAFDQPEMFDECVEHAARALMEYIPAEDQLFDAPVCPTGSNPDVVPSPQSN